MKKKVLLFTWIIAILASMCFFSCKNRVRDDEASGSIGKVKKYRKDQMTEGDILLRSDLMKDTTQLASIINGLVIFNGYANNLVNSLNNRLLDLESIAGFNDQYDEYIAELTDFRDFLKNNNEVLTTTVYMLGDFYKDTISESSADVENNLRLFANYVKRMEEKDSILTVMVMKLDDYMAEHEKEIVDKEELEKLISIRDEMLIRVIQQSYVLDEPDAIKSVAEKSIMNVDNLADICDVEQLQNVVGSQDLNVIIVPVGNFIIGDQGALQAGDAGPSGGGGGAPVKSPTDPHINIGPQIIQGLVVSDKGVLSQVDQLINNQFIGYSVVGNQFIVGSEGHLQSTLSNTEFVASVVISAQEFIGNNEVLSDIVIPK